jgi:hypothetical protein
MGGRTEMLSNEEIEEIERDWRDHNWQIGDFERLLAHAKDTNALRAENEKLRAALRRNEEPHRIALKALLGGFGFGLVLRGLAELLWNH